MGPNDLYLGPETPKEELIWQDPIPAKIINQPGPGAINATTPITVTSPPTIPTKTLFRIGLMG
jgi:catalase (peroxidase I)